MELRPQLPARPSIPQMLPVFMEVLPATVIEAAMATASKRFYHRLWTPFITVWCFVYQWLNADRTCDAVLAYVESGGVDALDPDHAVPPSVRVCPGRTTSHSRTAGYSIARTRLPRAVLDAALRHSAHVLQHWLPDDGRWYGHAVALLDGTTLLAPPTPPLVAAFGQHGNQQGPGTWVVIRAVAAFCLATGALFGADVGPLQESEQTLATAVLAALPPKSIVVGDANFGVFRVAQTAHAAGLFALVRLTASRARALAKRTGATGTDAPITWAPSPKDQTDPTLPRTPIPGRLLSVHLERPGFRPVDLWLFTTLPATAPYTTAALVDLYGRRWDVELDLRYVKATLDMAVLTTKSPDLVRKDILAGLLAYNLIRTTMGAAALRIGHSPVSLSFTACCRRLRLTLVTLSSIDTPAAADAAWARLLHRLGQCRLIARPRFRIEPRAVRKRRRSYPPLRESRAQARQRLRTQCQTPCLTKS